ncbi:MAG: hypothetical protein KC609_16620 [Myxococcales bacterium]|nr:hypothetical protein [Myxococcales bacterium]
MANPKFSRKESALLLDELVRRGVEILAPDTVALDEIDPARIEGGVRIYPGCTIRGSRTLLRRGCELGRAGGGYFENVACGANVALYGGYFQDCTFLDGVTVRGHAEMRGGTLLEEGCEAAHHVGYKMTIMLPFVVAGSLVNFCDAFVSGGTGRDDHSEIGSTIALYNFTPWADKFASLFGDVPQGVFLRSRPIFVGGQSQIVSPVQVGFGAVIAAGTAVRRDVPAGRLYGEAAPVLDQPFDPERYGTLLPKVRTTIAFIANLRALELWYREVRQPLAKDKLQRALYESAEAQIRAGIGERIKRLGGLVAKLPRSIERHIALGGSRERIAEQRALLDLWPTLEADLSQGDDSPIDSARSALAELADTLRPRLQAGAGFVDALRGELPSELIARCADELIRRTPLFVLAEALESKLASSRSSAVDDAHRERRSRLLAEDGGEALE